MYLYHSQRKMEAYLSLKTASFNTSQIVIPTEDQVFNILILTSTIAITKRMVTILKPPQMSGSFSYCLQDSPDLYMEFESSSELSNLQYYKITRRKLQK